MKLLTYNLWHGLNGRGWLRFGDLEPRTRRRLREARQVEILRELNADAVALQEVNPIWKRSRHLADELDRLALSQADSAGIKVMDVGPPFNLHSGLTTLIPMTHLGRKVQALKLSGEPRSFVWPWLSFQLQESRYALFVEWHHPEVGRILIVNVHLHHGFEYTAEFDTRLRSLATQEKWSPEQLHNVEKRLRQGDERRQHEIQRLICALRARERRYSMVVLMGDFNASPESAAIQDLLGEGYVDAAAIGDTQISSTWEGLRHPENSRFLVDFHSPVETSDLGLGKRDRQALNDLVCAHEGRARRIDYILLKAVRGSIHINKVEPVGVTEPGDLAPSDHYGLIATVAWKSPR